MTNEEAILEVKRNFVNKWWDALGATDIGNDFIWGLIHDVLVDDSPLYPIYEQYMREYHTELFTQWMRARQNREYNNTGTNLVFEIIESYPLIFKNKEVDSLYNKKNMTNENVNETALAAAISLWSGK